MSRHNDVTLYAQVISDPLMVPDKETGEYKKAIVRTMVVRGKRDLYDTLQDARYDSPIVITKNPLQLKEVEKLRENDMIFVKGFIATMDVPKISQCPHCGAKNKVRGEVVYVSPIYIERTASCDDVKGCITLLHKHAEISNQVKIIGSLCNEVHPYITPSGVHTAEYQLAVNRKYRVKEDEVTKRTDYPWVHSAGKIAENDKKVLHTGSEVLVDGIIRTRDLKGDDARKTKCAGCGQIYTWPDVAMEVVPYSVEYLRNCNPFDDNDGDMEDVPVPPGVDG